MSRSKLNKMAGMYNAARALSDNAKIPEPKAQDLQDMKDKEAKETAADEAAESPAEQRKEAALGVEKHKKSRR